MRLLLAGLVALLPAHGGGDGTPRLTPAAAGPYRVSGNHILDSKGRPYLVRGTALPTLTLKPTDIAGDGKEFGAFSPSSLISIRQRLNMNAVRLPVSPLGFEESAPYRARVAEVVRNANQFELLVILADVAPGFFTASSDARGAVVGEVVQRSRSSGETKTFQASECVGGGCRAVPIALSERVVTTVRLAGSGIRNAGGSAVIRVMVGGIAVPVVSFGAMDELGRDQVTIQLPAELRGAGETDLMMTLNSVLSNVVRIHCGAL